MNFFASTGRREHCKLQWAIISLFCWWLSFPECWKGRGWHSSFRAFEDDGFSKSRLAFEYFVVL